MTAKPSFPSLLPMMALFAVAAGAQAQTAQQPLTGQMLGGAPSVASTPAPLQAESLATVDLAAAPPAPVPSAAHRAVAAADPLPAAPRPARSEVGDATRQLFRLQASGQQAGARLPILGDQATASYARYLKSFEHEIPDFFETGVGKSNGASRSGR